MQGSYIDHRTSIQKNRSNTNIDNFKNYIKIFNEEDQFGKIQIEINFKKDNKILIRNVSLYRKNLIPNLDKFKSKGFDIQLANESDGQNTLSPSVVTNNHPEYSINNNGFMRNSYQTSFNQKFNMK